MTLGAGLFSFISFVSAMSTRSGVAFCPAFYLNGTGDGSVPLTSRLFVHIIARRHTAALRFKFR